jgi:hypothetical protein
VDKKQTNVESFRIESGRQDGMSSQYLSGNADSVVTSSAAGECQVSSVSDRSLPEVPMMMSSLLRQAPGMWCSIFSVSGRRSSQAEG